MYQPLYAHRLLTNHNGANAVSLWDRDGPDSKWRQDQFVESSLVMIDPFVTAQIGRASESAIVCVRGHGR